MKTLIFNGSPRPNGNTANLIDILRGSISGECKVINSYSCDISPCIDCGYCRENSGCALQDEMQDLYSYIENSDNIVIASPIYFSELTGKLLDVGSRFQTYFCSRYFRNSEPIAETKKGAVILVGGGDGNFDKAYDTACTLLRHISCTDIYPLVAFHGTNNSPAAEDEECLRGIKSIAEFFRQ